MHGGRPRRWWALLSDLTSVTLERGWSRAGAAAEEAGSDAAGGCGQEVVSGGPWWGVARLTWILRGSLGSPAGGAIPSRVVVVATPLGPAAAATPKAAGAGAGGAGAGQLRNAGATGGAFTRAGAAGSAAAELEAEETGSAAEAAVAGAEAAVAVAAREWEAAAEGSAAGE